MNHLMERQLQCLCLDPLVVMMMRRPLSSSSQDPLLNMELPAEEEGWGRWARGSKIFNLLTAYSSMDWGAHATRTSFDFGDRIQFILFPSSKAGEHD